MLRLCSVNSVKAGLSLKATYKSCNLRFNPDLLLFFGFFRLTVSQFLW